MYASEPETKFFLRHLKKTHKVLEWGSGQSTLEIVDKVKLLVSIEHNPQWYAQIKTELSKRDNHRFQYLLRPPSAPEEHGENHYTNFKEYVDAPLDEGPFDVILIDGRARVACASKCALLGHKNTLVFFHDFNLAKEVDDRGYYNKSLQYLEHIESVEYMAKFKIKGAQRCPQT